MSIVQPVQGRSHAGATRPVFAPEYITVEDFIEAQETAARAR